MEGEGERESWRMIRDGDMQMRGGRIKARSRGRQQRRREGGREEKKKRRPEMERE